MVAGVGEIDGRRVAVMRLRLHRHGRLDGRGRRAQDGAHARAGAAPAHPDRVAARLGRRPHPGDERLDLRGGRRAVPRAGDAVGRRAAGGGHARPLRGGHRLHPGPGRLHPDGEGHLVDGARRPPPGEGGDGRGRHRGGDGRLGRPHQGQRRRRPRGRPTTPSACATVRRLPLVLPVEQHRAAAGAGDRRSRRPAGRGALRHRADRAPARLRHVPRHRGDRRRRRVLPDEARVGQERHHVPSPASAASPSASSPASPRCSAARST